MRNAHAVARRYSRALADALDKPEAQDRALAELRDFATFLRADRFARAHLFDVRAKTGTREKVALAVAEKARFSETTGRFLRVVAEHARFEWFFEMVRLYSEELDRRRGILRASVAAAFPLTTAQHHALADALSSEAMGRKAALETREDAALLAGFVVRIGSRVYDASLRSQIERFAKTVAR